jgi:hypothetical protein
MLSREAVTAAVREVAPSFDIEKAYLFGSCARGEQTDASDVDICLETGPRFSLFNAGDFYDRLTKRLGVRVDVVSADSCYPFVRDGLMRDRVLLYER